MPGGKNIAGKKRGREEKKVGVRKNWEGGEEDEGDKKK